MITALPAPAPSDSAWTWPRVADLRLADPAGADPGRAARAVLWPARISPAAPGRCPWPIQRRRAGSRVRTNPLVVRPRRWLPYVFSYGMGAESTAGLVEITTNPCRRPPEIAPDFHNLIVIVAQTGDEWSVTGELVERFVLPLLRERRIRFVEVARNGPRESDGITVLQDTREPWRLHLDGVYRLSDEHHDSGTMPQASGHHTCAQKSKGVPLDTWRAQNIGDGLFYHMIGYNVLEQSRMAKDSGYAMGGRRMSRYLIAGWKMTRDDCVDYLTEKIEKLYGIVGLVWPKSCCRECPYISRVGWEEQLTRFKERPAEAVRHIVDEYCCLALNPRSGLYGVGKSMGSRLAADGAREVLDLAQARMAVMPWAVYRVRRRMTGPAKGTRSVRRVAVGPATKMRELLHGMARVTDVALSVNEVIPGAPKRGGDLDTHERLWVHRRAEGVYPTAEEFYVVAPAQPVDKEPANFDDTWEELGLDRQVEQRLATVPMAADALTRRRASRARRKGTATTAASSSRAGAVPLAG